MCARSISAAGLSSECFVHCGAWAWSCGVGVSGWGFVACIEHREMKKGDLEKEIFVRGKMPFVRCCLDFLLVLTNIVFPSLGSDLHQSIPPYVLFTHIQVRDFRGHEAPTLRLLWLDGGVTAATTTSTSSSGTGTGNTGLNSMGIGSGHDAGSNANPPKHLPQLQRLISGSMDNTVRAWNVHDMSGSVLLRARGGGGEIRCDLFVFIES